MEIRPSLEEVFFLGPHLRQGGLVEDLDMKKYIFFLSHMYCVRILVLTNACLTIYLFNQMLDCQIFVWPDTCSNIYLFDLILV